MVLDGQPLSLCSSHAAAQFVAVDAPYQRCLYPAFQPPPWQGGASVSRAIQGHFGRPRCLFAGGVPLRGAEPGARPTGGPPGPMALVQLPRADGSAPCTGLAGCAGRVGLSAGA